VLEDTESTLVKVLTNGDIDSDGLPDDWEQSHFGNLNQNPNDDFDGDGLTNQEELDLGTDPTSIGNAPSVPVVVDPVIGSQVTTKSPTLVVSTTSHGVEVPLYQFEVAELEDFSTIVASANDIQETPNETSWTVDQTLKEDTYYYWRARAITGEFPSEWVYGEFFVSTANDAPFGLTPAFPLQGESVSLEGLEFVVGNAIDPENEALTYSFEVIGIDEKAGVDEAQFGVVGIVPGIGGMTTWKAVVPTSVSVPRMWRAIATDPHGGSVATDWIEFEINSNPIEVPHYPLILAPVSKSVVTSGTVNLISKQAANAQIGFKYQVEVSSDPNFTSIIHDQMVSPLSSGLIRAKVTNLTDNQLYSWRIRAFGHGVPGPWSVSSFYVNLANSAPKVPSAVTAGQMARQDSLTPKLILHPGSDIDPGDVVTYDFELYLDPQLSTMIGSTTTSQRWWNVPATLTNYTRYYWRARVKDSNGVSSAWSDTASFFVSSDPIDDAASIYPIRFNAFPYASGILPFRTNQPSKLVWSDIDPDDDAIVSVNITGAPEATFSTDEDLDGLSDKISFPASSFAPGLYTLSLAIASGNPAVEVQASYPFTVLDIDPKLDSDGDGIADLNDNCPFKSNPGQSDSGGILTSVPDLIGDACQCGDVTGNGVVDQLDYRALQKALDLTKPDTLNAPELCNLSDEGTCGKEDATILRKILSNIVSGSGPQVLPKKCTAAQPS
ncbi:MAG: thrombospondin type 3 repeat-containing protein, partial [Bdellovibrionales bacterium]|nr:thrombospondin type 3 repeat-containing protein [Bdellovibrionales bacterium]